jgi:hypothetical protein
MPYNFTTLGLRFYFRSEGRRAEDFYSPLPGSNPRTLCPIVSTLTITPPRTTIPCITSASGLMKTFNINLKQVLYFFQVSEEFCVTSNSASSKDCDETFTPIV